MWHFKWPSANANYASLRMQCRLLLVLENQKHCKHTGLCLHKTQVCKSEHTAFSIASLQGL